MKKMYKSVAVRFCRRSSTVKVAKLMFFDNTFWYTMMYIYAFPLFALWDDNMALWETGANCATLAGKCLFTMSEWQHFAEQIVAEWRTASLQAISLTGEGKKPVVARTVSRINGGIKLDN